ncbi:MAG: hypothetical protein R3195_09020 [Gemmatimonadota bacterium]|nr:hypothetical protein [Gemmatimonadota bacterium]
MTQRRSWSRTGLPLGLVLGAMVIVGCSDDDDGVGPEPAVSLSQIAQEMAAVQTLELFTGTIDDFFTLSPTIAPVMAPAGTVFPSIVPGEGAPVIDSPLPSHMRVRTMPSRGVSFAAASQQPPLGLTCVWGEGTGGWIGGQDLFGPVPAISTFFELYELDGQGMPIEPLIPLSDAAHTGVSPGAQSGSVLDVNTFVNQDDVDLFNATVTGTYGGGSTFDIEIADGMVSDGTTVLDVAVSADPSLQETIGSIGNVVFTISVRPASNGNTVTLDLVCPECQSDNAVFFLEIGSESPFPISQGTVTIDDEVVATISGTLQQRSFSLAEGSELPASELGLLDAIFQSAGQVSDRMVDALIFGSCVGTGDRDICADASQPG